jgi:deoxyribonuclease (pyrimidine dimer)
MTRINIINPCDLLDQHLIAEWRELPRIPNTIKSGKAKLDLSNINLCYKLGSGHVKFFYNKLLFLKIRHDKICDELDKRSIKRNPLIKVELSQIDPKLCNDWSPRPIDYIVNIERLVERWDARKRAYHLTENNYKITVDSETSLNDYINEHLEKYYLI